MVKMENFPPEIHLKIYEYLDLSSLLNMRYLNHRFKEEIDGLMTFDLTIKGPVHSSSSVDYLFPMKVRSIKIRDGPKKETKEIQSNSEFLDEPQAQLLRYPITLKILDIHCEWIDEAFLHQILKEAAALKELEFEIEDGIHRAIPQGPNSFDLDLRSIFHEASTLESLTLRPWEATCSDGANPFILTILESLFPALSSFTMDLPPGPDAIDDWPYFPLTSIFKFISKHGHTLRKLELNSPFIWNEDYPPFSFQDSVQVDMESVNQLTHLTLRDVTQFELFSNPMVKDVLVSLTKVQKNLKYFIDDSGILDLDLFNHIVTSNSGSLLSFTAFQIPSTPNHEDDDVVDLSIFSGCTQLEKISLWDGVEEAQDHVVHRISNLHQIPLGVKNLGIFGLWFTDGDQLREFSERARPNLTKLDLIIYEPDSASIVNLCQIMANLLYNLGNINFIELEVKRCGLSAADVLHGDNPRWRAEQLRMNDFFRDFSDCEIEHYYSFRGGQLDFNEVQARPELLEGLTFTTLAEVWNVVLWDMTPEDKELAFQRWAHPLEPGRPVTISGFSLRGGQTQNEMTR